MGIGPRSGYLNVIRHYLAVQIRHGCESTSKYSTLVCTWLRDLRRTKLQMRYFLTYINASLYLSTFVLELFPQYLSLTPFLFDLSFDLFNLSFKLIFLDSSGAVDVKENMALLHIDPLVFVCLVAASIDSVLIWWLITSDRSVYLLRLNEPCLAVTTVPATWKWNLLHGAEVLRNFFLSVLVILEDSGSEIIACSKLIIRKIVLLLLQIAKSCCTEPFVSVTIRFFMGASDVRWGDYKFLSCSEVLMPIYHFSILYTSFWKDFSSLVSGRVEWLFNHIWSLNNYWSVVLLWFEDALRVCMMIKACLACVCVLIVADCLPLGIETLLLKSEIVYLSTISITWYLYIRNRIFWRIPVLINPRQRLRRRNTNNSNFTWNQYLMHPWCWHRTLVNLYLLTVCTETLSRRYLFTAFGYWAAEQFVQELLSSFDTLNFIVREDSCESVFKRLNPSDCERFRS